ncbi:hypothetical protein EON83_17550 [bacterium]|nr:MAG: hypothetical protein EON83_17550 [bacterium]
MLHRPEDNSEALEGAVTEALDGEVLRAQDWHQLASALELRRERLSRDLQEAHEYERDTLQKQLDEIDIHIEALEEEANISHFVEDSVKFSYEVRRLSEG